MFWFCFAVAFLDANAISLVDPHRSLNPVLSDFTSYCPIFIRIERIPAIYLLTNRLFINTSFLAIRYLPNFERYVSQNLAAIMLCASFTSLR